MVNPATEASDKHVGAGALSERIVALSAPMTHVLQTAARSAVRDSKILITGESGVGKDVIARYIHANSRRAHRAFVAVNCAGLCETLLESELFGHVKGSFTGAYRDKPGKLQLADQGTIFLDEVGEMTPRMQALLLRFLESGEVQPVGGDSVNRRVDTRVLTATNRDLTAMTAAGQFRADLMYRIRVVQIHVPPLRERAADIRPLAQHFLARLDPTLALSDDAWARLDAYDWPGNVRELQNLAEQLASVFHGQVVEAGDLPSPICRADNRAARASRDRRRQRADELYESLSAGTASFWHDVYGPFIERDLTRKDLRALISKALAATHGNYRELVRLFRLGDDEYKRLLNFLVRHDCAVDYRLFRRRPSVSAPPKRLPVGDVQTPCSGAVHAATSLRVVFPSGDVAL